MIQEQMQTLQGILATSERRTPAENNQKLQAHFTKIVQHAYATVPFYKKFYADADQANLPLLTRDLAQAADSSLISNNIPLAHGACYPLETSGSTGKAIKILATDFTRLFFDALVLRENSWHKRDLTKTLMAIRWERRGIAHAPQGDFQNSWGLPISRYHATGNSIFINVASSTKDQIAAILHYQPNYLNSYPSQLAALAEYCLEHNISLDFLTEIRTTGETFYDHYKKLIYEAWPLVKITDLYSSVEVGNIAHQCPEFGKYHVNIEHVMLEILNENNQPCQIHEQGKVLITTLLNYATPLIRYEIGDYATWGEPCQCGRTLPVIEKIWGRKRNRLHFPNGEVRFPYLGEREDRRKITDAVRKFQFVQHSVHDIEYKIVVSEPLSAQQEEQLKKLHQTQLGYPFNITITYHDDIPAGPSGKYEEFISHLK
ncbi:MAG: phenylacetate--CoA ligase family protein [Proteobacteria bacterium]|nr:phenylacetate--CoA ligase family protein [Pseudomonadota bacterium]